MEVQTASKPSVSGLWSCLFPWFWPRWPVSPTPLFAGLREYGAGLYVSEMITSRALVERTPTSMRLIKHHESETPRSIQLYGVDPHTVSEAVKFLVDEDLCDHIDLNFGCPVPK